MPDEFIQRYEHYPEEVLRAQNGKTVPLTDRPGGRVIGEATLTYVEGEGVLEARLRVDDPKVAEFLKDQPPYSIRKKES